MRRDYSRAACCSAKAEERMPRDSRKAVGGRLGRSVDLFPSFRRNSL